MTAHFLSAQELSTDTITSINKVNPEFRRLTYDSALYKLTSPPSIGGKTEEIMPASDLRYRDNLSIIKKTDKTKKPILPILFTPDLQFNINPSRWDLPVLGTTTSFAPTMTYRLSDRFFVYGGVVFTQYHNLSYIQNIIAPDWPAKSNITSQAFGGFAYSLHDRITLHGVYNHSLYNQLPSNMIIFSPAYNTFSVGADIDVWHGLGVTVDRVFELDKSGKMRQGMRYSPYINVEKFVKFLRGE
jgi:hypothetical protein